MVSSGRAATTTNSTALDDKILACITTTDVMLPPGLLSILADIAGNHFYLAGRDSGTQGNRSGRRGVAGRQPHHGVRVPADLHELPAAADRPGTALVAARGTGGPPHPVSCFRVLADQDTDHAWAPARRPCWRLGGAFIVWGIASGQRARIGYQQPGTPLYKPDSKVNQDMEVISNYMPTDEGWVVLETPDFADAAVRHCTQHRCGCSGEMSAYLHNRGDVLGVVDFGSVGLGADQPDVSQRPSRSTATFPRP